MKKNFKNKLLYFCLGVLACSVVGVTAATYFPSNDITYDNKESGLSSTNVQGAIDELYNECFPKPSIGEIIENLEKDEYECRYFFTGTNPNNYVTFNNETAGWRIISVECDGRIKIIKANSIVELDWLNGQESVNNEWNQSRPNIYLNDNYYNILTSIAKNQIVESNFSIGKLSGNEDNIMVQVDKENGTLWKGNIALPTISEYLRTNIDKDNCGTFNLYNENYNNCKSTSWMFNGGNWWSLSAYSDSAGHIFALNTDGTIGYGYMAGWKFGVYPTLYLSSKIKITGGNGSQSNPYQLSL